MLRIKLALDEIPLDEMQKISTKYNDIYSVLTVDASVKARKSYGGTAPECVLQQLERKAALSDKVFMCYIVLFVSAWY